MTHADAFLQAILAEPDDDAHRLLFADWLEERGDPRGAFIRIQCALERLDAGDPSRPDLEDEARALLERHEEEWTAPLRGVASEWRFRRGFVEEAAVSAAALAAGGSALFNAFPIQKLRLELRREDAPAVTGCPHLARVRVLDVSACILGDRGVEELLRSPHLTRLTGLDLAGNDLEGWAVRMLAASPLMPRLTWLSLRNNHALGMMAARSLAQAPAAAALQSLSVSDTNFGLNGLRDLLYSPCLTGLTELRAAIVVRHGVSGSPAVALAESPVLCRLTHLDLSGFSGLGGLPTLLQAPALGRLKSLRLACCNLRDDAARALGDSPYFLGLNTLDLGGNAVGPEGAKALADAPHLAGLRALHLGGNAVRDTGARALAASPYLTRLTALDLGKNSIGGPGLRALAASPNLDRLEALDLSQNYVNLESVRALAASPHLGRLTRLGLRGNRLEPAAARALAASPHLARLAVLHLDGNDIGDEGLHALLYSRNLTRLAELYVHQNGIGRVGRLAAMIAEAPCWGRLRKLDLRCNPLTLSSPEQERLRQRFGARVEL